MKWKKKELKEELLIDPKFCSLTSKDKAVVYVKEKYSSEERKNKFLYLKAFGKEVYDFMKINENPPINQTTK